MHCVHMDFIIIFILFYDTICVCKNDLPMYVFMYLFFTRCAPWSVVCPFPVEKNNNTMDVTGKYDVFS